MPLTPDSSVFDADRSGLGHAIEAAVPATTCPAAAALMDALGPIFQTIEICGFPV